jgi:polysaccharide export outer membrane protein
MAAVSRQQTMKGAVLRKQRSVSILAAAVGALGVLLSGCSELVPGLNVRTSGTGHSYKIVQGEDGAGYQVESTNTGGRYRIVPITAEVLKEVYSSTDPDSTGLPSLTPSTVPPEYRMGASDIVYVTVWDHPELTSPYATAVNDSSVQAVQGRLVAADGSMYYPYVGVFKAGGMTSGELRDFLTKKLARVIADPQVDVRVVAFRAGRIEVTGEVLRPGTITLDDTPKGVLQAIGISGGLTPAASRRRAVLVRDGKSYQIDLAGLLSGNGPVANPALQPGDVLHLPDQSGDEVFVLGAVNKQQPFPIEQDSMPLIRALTDAGGMDPVRASQSGVLVFRMHRGEQGTEATVYTLDMSHPDGMLLASQFPLRPRDVVYVQATALSQYNSVIQQLLPTVTTVFDVQELIHLSK